MSTKKAVLVAGGSHRQLAALIEKVEGEKILIGIDRGALALLSLFGHMDAAIGDFDSISEDERKHVQTHAGAFVALPAKKDVTDTEAALTYVQEHCEVEEIYLFGAFGGRADHLLSNVWLGYQPRFETIRMKLRLIDSQNSLRFFPPGQYELQREADKRYLSFISMTPVENLTLEQVKYPLYRQNYAYPMALVSNEFTADSMSFAFTDGLIAVIQSKDHRV